VAQDQRVEFLFAAQVTGQNQMQQLIASVDALRKETDRLKTANGGLASSTDAVVRNGVRYNNALDAQSKALRQTRQGTQQLGLQINDFATSVATGASPLQAFNQQIGQVGYAMSQMGGTAGVVGTFLAGPFGAALTIATAVLVPLVMNLFQFGDAAEAAKKKADDLRKVEKDFASSTLKLMESRLALQGPIEENVAGYRRLYLGAIEAANGELQLARAAVAGAQARMKAAAAEADTIKKLKSGSREGKQGIAKSGLAGLIGSAVGVGLDFFGYGKGEDAARSEVTAAKSAANIAEAGVNSAKKILQDFEKDAATGFSKSSGSASGSSAGNAAKRIAKSSPQAKAAFSMKGFYEEYFAKEFEQADKGLAKTAEDQIKSLIDTVPDLAKISPEMDAILTRADEIAQSFDAVGNAVANSFKGMLTGAMSFKSAMKGIIGAVIDELFRLYVVKQIVGIVTSALGGPPPARAYGGSVTGKKPYMVGERGPELFVPGGNGTIIPNSNMRGGGGGGSSFNISVDARGSNDPAAVRAQVQQGILEAAPAIIAAAESRTISSLRRPRLGGVMQ
jgi:hypothetical protein